MGCWRTSIEQEGDECRPQVTRRGTRHWIRGVGLAGSGCERRLVRRSLRDQSRGWGAQRRIGSEHTVVAVPMHPRWHQCGDAIDQFQRGDLQLGDAVGLRLGQVVAEMGISCIPRTR